MQLFLRRLFYLSLLFAILGIATIVATYYILAPKLPDIEVLKETQLQVPLRIFSSEGQLIAEFGEKRRIPVEYNDIPPALVHAFLASEDDRFFEHPGVDYQGILRAIYSLAVTGERAQGGSTITMQVARNFFLSSEKTYLRKLNEIILSLQIEQVLSKEEILTLYLNKIFLGNRSYGVAAAAEVYYGKTLQELTLPQIAMIAGLPKAPSTYNPIANPDRAKLRRNYVLRRMFEVGHISEEEYKQSILAPITSSYHTRSIEVYSPYVAEMVRTQLIEKYGEDTYNKGFSVYTTIKAKHQQASNHAIKAALLAYDKRHGYRGALNNIPLTEGLTSEDFEQALTSYDSIGPLQPGLVTEVEPDTASVYVKAHGMVTLDLKSLQWAKKQLSTNRLGKKINAVSDVLAVGDQIYLYQDEQAQWQLTQIPQAQGAFIAVSPYDGAITALNGGFDYFQNKFNRVTQSRRQPGSGFKPFIYSAALEKGYTAATIINDSPIVDDNASIEELWRPQNSSKKFYGPTRLRVALTYSRNLVSIRILRDIGTQYVIDYAKKFGFDTSQMPNGLSLALGSGSASPFDMARAYSALANGGYRIEPYLIQRIEDASGNIIMQAEPETVCETCLATDENDDSGKEQTNHIKAAKRIMTPQNNYIMNSLLRDVVRQGTGHKAMELGRNDLAGKTGTTNDQVDAWFNGYHRDLVAIAWVGFDSPQSLGRGEYGGKAALPMWMDFMKVALDDVPESKLTPPPGMVTVKIDSETGLLSGPTTTKSIYETFRKQYIPKQAAPTVNLFHDSASESSETGPVDLF